MLVCLKVFYCKNNENVVENNSYVGTTFNVSNNCVSLTNNDTEKLSYEISLYNKFKMGLTSIILFTRVLAANQF